MLIEILRLVLSLGLCGVFVWTCYRMARRILELEGELALAREGRAELSAELELERANGRATREALRELDAEIARRGLELPRVLFVPEGDARRVSSREPLSERDARSATVGFHLAELAGRAALERLTRRELAPDGPPESPAGELLEIPRRVSRECECLGCGWKWIEEAPASRLGAIAGVAPDRCPRCLGKAPRDASPAPARIEPDPGERRAGGVGGALDRGLDAILPPKR